MRLKLWGKSKLNFSKDLISKALNVGQESELEFKMVLKQICFYDYES